jgi:hypothetical protein
MKKKANALELEEDAATIGMPSLFPLYDTKPVVVEHTLKAEHLKGRDKRGRRRNYSDVKDMMQNCRRITYVLRKDGEEVIAITCATHRTAWEASRLVNDLLKRRLGNEITMKYEH